MSTVLQDLIDREVSTILESFRGFRLSVFKNLDSERKRIEYAVENLPYMGAGSARTVFAIGSGKVLKMAGDRDALETFLKPNRHQWERFFTESIQRGYLQNKAEVDLYTHPEARPILAKIFDFADDYSWLVSEAAQPLKKPDEVSQHLGVPMYHITDFLQLYKNNDGNISDLDIKDMVNVLANDDYAIRQLNKITDIDIENKDDVFRYLKEDLPKHPIFGALIHLVTDLGHSEEDLNKPEHWGKTADGRLVLLDYGFTDDVLDKAYS